MSTKTEKKPVGRPKLNAKLAKRPVTFNLEISTIEKINKLVLAGKVESLSVLARALLRDYVNKHADDIAALDQ